MKIVKFIFFIIILWWFFFSHVSVNTANYKVSTISDPSRESEYFVEYYKPSSVNIYGLYFNYTDGMYLVLRDKNGNYIGQSSPFKMTDWIENLLYPNKYMDCFDIVSIDYENAYEICPNKKKYWDYFLKYFYSPKN